ncbi:MAG TPA: hypothetical protein VFC37_01505, partial [Terracidiphilus sp.]|nr:hypothetical protein [Terracidiphilus sp.]
MNRPRLVLILSLLMFAMSATFGYTQDASLPKLTKPVSRANEPGLLFYLSGDNGFNADFAASCASPKLHPVEKLNRCLDI